MGSEMCIRDSRWVIASALAQAAALWPDLAAEPTIAAYPVSYTHLTLPTIYSV